MKQHLEIAPLLEREVQMKKVQLVKAAKLVNSAIMGDILN